MPDIELSIIIVNWHSQEYLRQSIASIQATTCGISYEIIVVDSGSFDGCDRMLRDSYPWVRFVQSHENLGFGRANTLAVSYARGSVLLFLNPDTEVTDGAIVEMYTHLTALSAVGVLGCRLLNGDGSLQTSCVQAFPTILNQMLDADVIRRWFPSAALFGTRALFRPSDAVTEVEAVSGACMMVRRDVFARVGGFSAEYFMYAEDVDLCFKMRRAGFRNYHVSDAVVIHHGGGSTQQTVSGFSAVMMVDSVNRLLRKSRGTVYSGGHRMCTIAAAAIRLVILGGRAPVALAMGKTTHWRAAAGKWFSILRWGVGLEPWTTDFNGSPVVTPASHGADTSCAGSAEN